MSRQLRVALSVAVLLFAIVGVLSAQRIMRAPGKEPPVIAGPDIGFRVDHYNGDTPVGELVVKQDGTWVPIQFGVMVKRSR
jgi:hypothetical protein